MKKKILVVDDSPFILEEIKRQLSDSNFEVAGYAKSGEQALEMFDEIRPDIVTMDIIMPGMDGYQTASLLQEKCETIQIIMLSSLAYDETIAEAKTMGIDHFLFKPFNRETLLTTLVEACKDC